MFVADTQIFTDTGWKTIENVSGHDRVLVRNFLGDAEFIQPFAVKKRKYDGEVVQIGARNWSFTVTPDHQVVYETDNTGKFRKVRAEDLVATNHNRIHRKFKYMFADQPKRENINIYDEFGTRNVRLDDYDWYKLVGYVISRGFIKTGYGRPMLHILLDLETIQQDILILSDIFDRLGIPYHIQYPENNSPRFVVSSKNTIAARLITRLGSSTRKEMYLPDKIIYQSTKELAKLLIETIVSGSQLVTTNKRLLDSLVLLGTLNGYTMSVTKMIPKQWTDKLSYILTISGISDTYSPKYVKKTLYSGYIYGLDLFEGQVYVKKDSMPVWTNPK